MFKKYLFLAMLVLSLIPALSAWANSEPEEASPSQAQATMASLFGRGAKMPGIPRMGGTIALPSFDSSGMVIDEGSLSEAGRNDQRPETEDLAQRATGNAQRNS